jgi:hypothetical protein
MIDLERRVKTLEVQVAGLAARGGPRSSAPSPSRRSQDREARSSRATMPPATPLATPIPGKPDTEPSGLSALTDDELRPYYNEWMRRNMRGWRKRQREKGG